MILSFADSDTQQLYREDTCPARWRAFRASAVRKLDMVNAAVGLDDLRSPPGNRLEALKADRKGQFSVRINQQWRICFRWTENGAEQVEIVDYH